MPCAASRVCEAWRPAKHRGWLRFRPLATGSPFTFKQELCGDWVSVSCVCSTTAEPILTAQQRPHGTQTNQTVKARHHCTTLQGGVPQTTCSCNGTRSRNGSSGKRRRQTHRTASVWSLVRGRARSAAGVKASCTFVKEASKSVNRRAREALGGVNWLHKCCVSIKRGVVSAP